MRPATPTGWALCAFALALPLSIAGANVGWGLVAAALAWEWRRGPRPDLAAARGPLWRPLWAYAAAALAADLLGHDPGHSLRYLNQDLHKLWIAALLAAAFSRRGADAVVPALALSFAAAAAIGIRQNLATLDMPPWDRVRAHAFVHPVTYGEQMALGALACVCAVFQPWRGAKGGGAKWAAAGLLLLSALALFLSNTRGALLAFVAGSVGVVALQRRWRWAALGVLVIGAAAYLGMEVLRSDRSVTMQALATLRGGAPIDERNIARLTLWRVAWEMGWDHPLTGVGVNNYRALLPRYFQGVFEDLSLSWGTAHNLYLHHFAERGLLGLAALGWLLWTMAARALERARRAPGFWTLWAWGTTVAFLVMNLTEVALQTELVWLLMWTVWLAAEAEARAEGA